MAEARRQAENLRTKIVFYPLLFQMLPDIGFVGLYV